MTDDLAARLLAAIEETEKIAQAIPESRRGWRYDGLVVLVAAGDPRTAERVAVGACDYAMDPAVGHHIARQHPRATLIRCAADRKIVARHVKVTEMWNEDDDRGLFDVDLCGTCAYGRSCEHCFSREDLPLVAWPCPTLRDLAEGYGLSTGVASDG